uniref:protein kinase domain-containing protein n=1 Tax=Salmonella sp. s51228 TaxID=3159652 RepID=UPI0039813FD3
DAPYWDEISSTARDFISKLLILDPKQRMTCKECMKHPWLVSEAHKGSIHAHFGQKMGKTRKRWAKVVNAAVMIQRMKADAQTHKVESTGATANP